MNIKEIIKRENLVLLGISLSMLGVPMGMYFTYLFPIVKWTWLIMFFSILFIVDTKNLRRFIFPSKSKMLGIILIFQLILLIYGFFSGFHLTESKYIYFHLYIICLCISYSTRKVPTNINKLPQSVFLISLLGNIYGAYLSSIGMIMGEEWFDIKQRIGDIVLEPITASSCSAINIVAGIFMRKNHPFTKFLFILSIVCGFYLFLITNKRTFVLFVIFALLIYSYKNISFTWKSLQKLFVTCAIGLIVLNIARAYIPDLNDKVSHLFEHFYRGIQTLFGNRQSGDLTGSAIARVEQRNVAFREFETNATVFNYIFGKGYFFAFIDAPLLQSYLEMGLIGLFFYIRIVVLYPISNALTLRKMNNGLLFPLVMSFYPFLQMFSAGTIQGYDVYTNICLLAFILNKQKNK